MNIFKKWMSKLKCTSTPSRLNEADLVTFGTYLLSDIRRASFVRSREEGISSIPLETALKEVHREDLRNWKAAQ